MLYPDRQFPPGEKIIAFLFPGVGISYAKAIIELQGLEHFKLNCIRAGINDIGKLTAQSLMEREQLQGDDFDVQKIAYILNCTVSDCYKSKGIYPKVILGYSMGILPALYAAECYSFETGLQILEKSYQLVEGFCKASPKKYGVGIILGLTEEDIRDQILKKVGDGIEIVIYNGRRSFIISGEKDELDFCLAKSLKLGALSARPIVTQHPYHSPVMRDIFYDFVPFLNALPYAAPTCTVMSAIDGSPITQAILAEKIAATFCSPLRFDKAVEKMFSTYHVTHCFEAGPINSIKKLVRYIRKDFCIYSYNNDLVSINAMRSQSFASLGAMR
jgi:malonyl CoA-acyl carrier protein transacylase